MHRSSPVFAPFMYSMYTLLKKLIEFFQLNVSKEKDYMLSIHMWIV